MIINRQYVRSFKAVSALCVLVLLSACSVGKTYKNSGKKNLVVNAQLEDITTYLGVHQMTSNCDIQYLGSVELKSGRIELAIPTEETAYLVVAFSSSSFFTGSSNFRYELAINMQPTQLYELDISYKDKIYNVTPYQRDSSRVGRRELSGAIPKQCAGR